MTIFYRALAGLYFFILVMAGIGYAGQSSVPITPGSGTNIGVVTTAAGSNVSMGVLCDGAAAATCATVSGGALSVSVGGTVSTSPTGNTPVSGSVSVTGTVSTSPTGTTNVICLSGCSAATGTDITKWATTSLASATNYGTAPSGIVGSVNAFVTSGTISASGNVAITNVNANGQATKANSSPVTIASDQYGDPCYGSAKSTSTIYTQATTQVIVAGSVGKKIYVCSVGVIAGAAGSFSLVEGTSTATSQLPVMGSTTATSGYSFAINGGMTKGSGTGTVAQTVTSSNYLLTLLSGGNFTVDISYVQQ